VNLDIAESIYSSNWETRYLLDSIQLEERIIFCNEINKNIKQKLLYITKDINFHEMRMNSIKGLAKALVNLKGFINNKMEANKPVTSSVYDLKDLMRCSFVCNNIEETKKLFDVLTSENPYFET